jgi:hypothetical protein
MNFLYFDCIGGVSGDMLLASFLDGLVPYDYLVHELDKLDLPGYTVDVKEEARHHISAKKVNINCEENKSHRHLKEIVSIINSSSLNESIKKNIVSIFTLLGEQEAKIHNIALEKIHFHEVGAIDSIVDITGCCICIDYLKVERIYSSPLPVSYGFVKAAHGNLPLPAPATLAILENYPLRKTDIQGELVTPTGAAIIKHFSHGLLEDNLSFRIINTGYGAGSKDFIEIPNLLRTWLCEKIDKSVSAIMQIETNIDDMNPEIYPFLMEKLLAIGVNDIWFGSVSMKHGRPGTQITILAAENLLERIKDILFKETTTIGFRYFQVQREVLDRKQLEVDSPWGKILVKEVVYKNSRKIIPEFRECKRIAEETGIPVLEVFKKIAAIGL